MQVEETFGDELAKREHRADKSMYVSESRSQLERTAAMSSSAISSETKKDVIAPKAAVQNINLFAGRKKDDRFVTTNASHFRPQGGAIKKHHKLRDDIAKRRERENVRFDSFVNIFLSFSEWF